MFGAKYSLIKGFTLAELLVALSVFSVITTFTIPKVLTVYNNEKKFNLIAKDIAATMTNAVQLYKANNSLTGTTTLEDVMVYVNTVKRDTTTIVDSSLENLSRDCSLSNIRCYQLHSGGIMWFRPFISFNTNDEKGLIPFSIDPNGQYDGTGIIAVELIIYANGRVRSIGESVEPGAACSNSGTPFTPVSRPNPAWFKWSS